jgi:hypothetical protein
MERSDKIVFGTLAVIILLIATYVIAFRLTGGSMTSPRPTMPK